MVLQEIKTDFCDNSDLYFHIEGKYKENKEGILLLENTIFSTDTYYSSLSIGKWRKYCDIEKIKLNINMQGKALITVMHSSINAKGDLESKTIYSDVILLLNKDVFEIEIPNVNVGSIHFRIKSMSNQTYIYGACYVAQVKREREINLALNICTYKREQELISNIELLEMEFINNVDSPLYGHLKVFITDNGCTLDINTLSTSNVFVYYNPNVGGAGGFSRGLLEICKIRESQHITNAIFMDDDIEICPEAIIRTFRMLSIIKNEYKGAFIAGAMLRKDFSYIQYENGALWNGGKCEFINRGLDLRKYKNVVYNEIEKNSEYGAWWYCCIPAEVITEDNLAMPMFIHMDDIEYSLRNANYIITLNGIAVCHPVNDQRVVSSNEYYDLRNMLILNSKYYPNFGKIEIKKELIHRMLNAYLHYRYKDVRLLYKAINDFYKGPDWIMQLDAAEYHKKIQEEGYKLQDISHVVDIIVPSYTQDDSPIVDFFGKKRKRWTVKKVFKLLFIMITLNGAYLPSKKKMAYDMNVSPAKLFRQSEVILFDRKSMQGITLKRDFMKIVELLHLYVKACRIIDKHHSTIQCSYKEKWSELHSTKYWKKVIDKEVNV